MSGFLLDTDVVSELVKPRPEPNVAEWIETTNEELLFLSVLTIGEIRKGIALINNPARVKLEAWLARDLPMRFAGRILVIDKGIAERWGVLSAQVHAVANRLLPVIDGLLAATAQHHNLTFVTRNTHDVVGTGVAVFNPWLER
jgi:predicted nucleic acid-binding protein